MAVDTAVAAMVAKVATVVVKATVAVDTAAKEATVAVKAKATAVLKEATVVEIAEEAIKVKVVDTKDHNNLHMVVLIEELHLKGPPEVAEVEKRTLYSLETLHSPWESQILKMFSEKIDSNHLELECYKIKMENSRELLSLNSTLKKKQTKHVLLMDKIWETES